VLRTLIKPEGRQINLDILPEYFGKEIEIISLSLEELHQEKQAPSKTMKDFWGIISNDTAAKLHEHVVKSREEWKRNI
jgi:hypothetical protein